VEVVAPAIIRRQWRVGTPLVTSGRQKAMVGMEHLVCERAGVFRWRAFPGQRGCPDQAGRMRRPKAISCACCCITFHGVI
jgi:hypothetical protein